MSQRRGFDLIRLEEQFRANAYKPTPNDVWTIGYGETLGVKEGDTTTEPEACAKLQTRYDQFEHDIQKVIHVPVNENQLGALVSLVYNIGVPAFATSTILRLINTNAFDQAAEQFARWNKQAGVVLKGLVRRRAEERTLFLTPA